MHIFFYILLYGAANITISAIAACTAVLVMQEKLNDSIPEVYYKYKKQKKDNKAAYIFSTIVFFFPFLGTILVFDILHSVINLIILNKNLEKNHKMLQDIKLREALTLETPEERMKKLKKGQEEYHAIKDQLRMEGLNDREIKKEMKKAKKEEPYISKDNSKQIKECKLRIHNLQLLEPLKDYLKNPSKAYKYTLGKVIQKVELKNTTLNNDSNDELIISISKGNDNENPKILTKSFILK